MLVFALAVPHSVAMSLSIQAFGYWKVEILVNALSAMKAR